MLNVSVVVVLKWSDGSAGRSIPFTEFRVHAVSNKDKVFLPRFMVQVQSKKTVNPSTNDEIPLTYSRDEENKVGKIFIISVG